MISISFKYLEIVTKVATWIKLINIWKKISSQINLIILVWNGKYRLSLFWTDVEGNASDPGFIFIWVHVLTITGSLGKRGSGFRLDGVTFDGEDKLSDWDVKSSVRGLFGGQVICGEGALWKKEDEESDLEKKFGDFVNIFLPISPPPPPPQ